MLPTLSFIMVILPKVPILGSSATTVRVIRVVAAFQLRVLDCVAVIFTLPPSNNVTIFPLIEAMVELDDE